MAERVVSAARPHSMRIFAAAAIPMQPAAQSGVLHPAGALGRRRQVCGALLHPAPMQRQERLCGGGEGAGCHRGVCGQLGTHQAALRLRGAECVLRAEIPERYDA